MSEITINYCQLIRRVFVSEMAVTYDWPLRLIMPETKLNLKGAEGNQRAWRVNAQDALSDRPQAVSSAMKHC